MTKHIEAFFESENDAESAKADLQELSIEKELVEPIPADTDLGPIIPIAGSASSGPGAVSFEDVAEPTRDGALFSKKHLTHVLHFYLKDEEFDHAVKKIEKHNGHMNEKHL
ncbi:hypothetical protein H0266_16585 [Halobacillus locisalis]|uniref:Heat induced stress protein YflT n=1 Tax=Halobacillus locisalis TaxID=220753 RepID=A0A838CWU7_9BACI|nr:hypothetical protein [Halobacillus locisalis]MBA2176517.1 hypothetical protein [Halobacillus locisalis]